MEKLGLSFNRLINDIDIYCWDLDGTLGVYAFGENGVDSCNDAYYQEYLRKCNPYENVIPCVIIKRFIDRYTDKDKNYVITVAQSKIEERYKLGFILKHYGDKIKPENIIFVEKRADKYDALCDIESQRKGCRICLIDDTVGTLSSIQATSLFSTVHTSSFMSFSELFKD